MALSDLIVGAESGGNANATNPNSSATGAGQFINSTWLSMIKQHRPDLAEGKSDQDILAMRSDPALSKQMVDAYAADNQAILQKNGLPVTPGTTYLAHFAGPQGAVSLLKADPNASAAGLLGEAAAKANPFLKNMTVGGLLAWADKKMGAAPMASVTNTAPASGPILAAPQQMQAQAQAAPAAPQATQQAAVADYPIQIPTETIQAVAWMLAERL